MIAMLFIGCILFARNSLAGQPVLQQRLVKLPIYAGIFSDVSCVILSSPPLLSLRLSPLPPPVTPVLHMNARPYLTLNPLCQALTFSGGMALRHPDPKNPTPGPPYSGTLDTLYRRADLWATYRDAAQAHLALWDRQGYGLSRRTDVGLGLGCRPRYGGPRSGRGDFRMR
jgi:hypothetical protein